MRARTLRLLSLVNLRLLVGADSRDPCKSAFNESSVEKNRQNFPSSLKQKITKKVSKHFFIKTKIGGDRLLHLDGFESAVQLLALVDLSNEEVTVATVDLRVSDVDHVLVDVEVHLG